MPFLNRFYELNSKPKFTVQLGWLQSKFVTPIRFASVISDAGQDVEEVVTSKAGDEEDELVFDLELEGDLDFTTYHEDDDNKDFSNVKDDKQIILSLSEDVKY